MFSALPVSSYDVKPVKLSYLNPNRDFMGDFVLSGVDDSHQFQQELSAVWDFSLNNDSVNILTEPRETFSDGIVHTGLAVYTEDLPNLDCSLSASASWNYWATFGKDSSGLSSDSVCNITGNIVPLKNNFSETHEVTCNASRVYTNFGLGERGLDNFKPKLIYTTDHETTIFDDPIFTFRLPDYAENLIASAVDFSCFGVLAGDNPFTSDNIIWGDNPHQFLTWLSGTECQSVWVDRYYGLSGTSISDYPNLESVAYSDIVPSEILLLSGVDYIYKRPESIPISDVVSDNMLFGAGGILGDVITDISDNHNDAKFV
jgi:hypothetical protein